MRALKHAVPELGVITDVALDPFTTHGQDGIVDDSGYVQNDVTIEALVRQARSQAEAGADIVAPSDMMDGRIGAIRAALEEDGRHDTRILAYSAKYASGFYGPFRDAVGSARRARQGRQGELPDGSRERGRGAARSRARHRGRRRHRHDQAGPALPRHRAPREGAYGVPTFVYQVQRRVRDAEGGGANGWLDERARRSKASPCIKRAGADGILSYFAGRAAAWLRGGLNACRRRPGPAATCCSAIP